MEILSGLFSFGVLSTVFATGVAVGACVSIGLVFLFLGIMAAAAGGSAISDAKIAKEPPEIKESQWRVVK